MKKDSMTKRQRANLSSDIFETLKQRILNWEYAPGFRLREEALCQEFHVSRVPVREALHMLEEDGLVDKRPHQGCRVHLPDAAEIKQLYGVRLALELFVVESLATNGMSAEKWQPLYDTWQRLYRTRTAEELSQISLAWQDTAFHEALAAATGNDILLAYLRNINERVGIVRLTDITTLERLLETCQQHLPILEHIRDGNVAEAREAMAQNIAHGRDNVNTALKNALARVAYS